MKPMEFLGNARKALAAFPTGARRAAGFQLDRIQRGIELGDWKPFRPAGQSAIELRVRDSTGAFRVVYVAKFEDAIYVLHAFQKKGRKTGYLDTAMARVRFAELMRRQLS